MDKAYIERENVIERYVQGKLDFDESSEFEIFMLEHPETAEDVEYARGLQDGMNAAQSEFFLAGAPASTRRDPSWPTTRYAAAAGVVLASLSIATALLYQRTESLGAEIERLRSPASISNEIWLEPMRGGDALIIEQQPGDAVLLRALVDERAQGPYRIEVFAADGRSIWSESNVSADEEPAVAIFARDLPLGTYRLLVTAERDAEIAADYSIELLRSSDRQ